LVCIKDSNGDKELLENILCCIMQRVEVVVIVVVLVVEKCMSADGQWTMWATL